jgi:hypothetical protein
VDPGPERRALAGPFGLCSGRGVLPGRGVGDAEEDGDRAGVEERGAPAGGAQRPLPVGEHAGERQRAGGGPGVPEPGEDALGGPDLLLGEPLGDVLDAIRAWGKRWLPAAE